MKKDSKRSLRELIRLLPNSTYIFVVLFIAFVAFIPNFGSATNISSLIGQAAILMILSSAMSVAIITGGIDLSVGGIVSLVGVVMAQLVGHGMNDVMSILLGLAFGCLFGLVNGIVVVKLKVAPFIATFGMQGVAYGLANTLSDSRALYMPDEGVPVIKALQTNLLEWMFPSGNILTISVQVLITIVTLMLLILFFKKTVFGTYIYALGGNREAAKLSNIRTDKWNIMVYVITGLLASVAALLMLLRINSAQPTSGDGLEFQAVVAAVLGGNYLAGGRGSIPGAILGALVVYTVRNGLSLAGVNANMIMVVLGIVLVLGMVMNEVAVRGLSFGDRRKK
ncbi:MAG: ABC transporter permease [Candidatus Avilachnospira sp.]|jgi:ribose/xylose/arabinose/galactoside ABC-type transport system permease subunit